MNSEQLSELVINTLEELKGKDIVRIDVSALTTLTDYMIVLVGRQTDMLKHCLVLWLVNRKKRDTGR